MYRFIILSFDARQWKKVAHISAKIQKTYRIALQKRRYGMFYRNYVNLLSNQST